MKRIKLLQGVKSQKKSFYSNTIIPRDKEIIFDNEKLDNLFSELKTLPFDKKYSFAVLLRTYLEQSLYFFIQENDLLGELSDKLSDDNKKKWAKES
ncbi:hypothetical protein ACIXCI_02130 [Bacteroides fragilis]